MTARTGKALMSTLKFKIRRLVVIEIPQRPTIGVVALCAIRTQTLFVDIFGLMALHAVFGRLLEGR